MQWSKPQSKQRHGTQSRAGKRAGRETPRMRIDIRARKGAAVAQAYSRRLAALRPQRLETRPSLDRDTTGAQGEPIFYRRRDAMRAFHGLVPDAFVWDDLITAQRRQESERRARRFWPQRSYRYRDDLTAI